MTVISIRNRVEWAIVGAAIGAAFFYLTYFMYVTEGPSAGFACYITGIIGVFFVRHFLLAPPNVSLRTWWWHNVTPGYYGVPRIGGPLRIIKPRGKEANVFFDLNGKCVGDEDYVIGLWHYHPIDSDCQYDMPKIAWWLTKLNKPIGMR